MLNQKISTQVTPNPQTNFNFSSVRCDTEQTASDLKLQGMSDAIAHADHVYEGWSDDAYALLKEFVSIARGQFMCEDIRAYAHIKGLPDAPSGRAWGGLICRAKREGLIKSTGYSQVKNPRAHQANASLWSAV
jgi:hypothetical protein